MYKNDQGEPDVSPDDLALIRDTYGLTLPTDGEPLEDGARMIRLLGSRFAELIQMVEGAYEQIGQQAQQFSQIASKMYYAEKHSQDYAWSVHPLGQESVLTASSFFHIRRVGEVVHVRLNIALKAGASFDTAVPLAILGTGYRPSRSCEVSRSIAGARDSEPVDAGFILNCKTGTLHVSNPASAAWSAGVSAYFSYYCPDGSQPTRGKSPIPIN